MAINVVAAGDPVHDRISAEFLRKYARWPKDVAPMVIEPALQATVRAVPA